MHKNEHKGTKKANNKISYYQGKISKKKFFFILENQSVAVIYLLQMVEIGRKIRKRQKGKKVVKFV
jgi:hypothetical protein